MARLTAVLPAAGLGTRLRPLTDAVPKELLPLGRLPVIGHVLDEVAHVVEDVWVVVSPAKQAIRNYCRDGRPWNLRCSYAVQEQMRGVGDAVLCAAREGASPPLVVAFADCAVLPALGHSGPPALRRLIAAFHETCADAAVLCEEVPREKVRQYGVLHPQPGVGAANGPWFGLADIVEKPAVDAAPSNLVVAARWVLGEKAIEALRGQPAGANGEVGITEAIRALIRSGGRVIAVPLGSTERRCDVGNFRSYLEAQLFASLNDPQHGRDLRAVLRCFMHPD